MKIYRRGKKQVIITKMFPYDDGLSICYKEIGNDSQFYIYLFSKDNFNDFFIDTGKILKNNTNNNYKQFGIDIDESNSFNKNKFNLIPYSTLKRIIQAYECWILKYDKEKFTMSCGIDNAIMHIHQYVRNLKDEDHLAQAICNLLGVMYFETLIEEDSLPGWSLNELLKYYMKDDLDEYIEKRSKTNPEFKKAIEKREGSIFDEE